MARKVDLSSWRAKAGPLSLAAYFVSQSNETQIKRDIEALTVDEQELLAHCWEWMARPKQLAPPGDWSIWLMLAGRGGGKSRAGAEWVRKLVESGKYKYGALVGTTAKEVRKVIVQGESGILATANPNFRPVYEPSKCLLTWPNGATATTYSADEPKQLRGPHHDFAWADELAAWRFDDAWEQLLLGLMLGPDPRCVVTTTPRPIPIIKNLITNPDCIVTTWETFENVAFIAPTYLKNIVRKLEGTRLGRQELYAELLTDNPGALWKQDDIDKARVDQAPQLILIVVGLDPNTTTSDESDECGIVVAGQDARGEFYILQDASERVGPAEWAKRAIGAYRTTQADVIIYEANQGGEMVPITLATVDPTVPTQKVTATRGKHTRAQPVASLYEQGRVHHVGTFAALEDQMTSWEPGAGQSPDRMDALVWAMYGLMEGPRNRGTVVLDVVEKYGGIGTEY